MEASSPSNTQEIKQTQPNLNDQMSGVSSQVPSDLKAQSKALLAEARNTRDVLVDFRAAVESGTYAGTRMMAVAKGMAFLEAILHQNSAHIKNLQERSDA